jgi:hypothetical protein
VTSAATPETAAAATFSVDGESLTQEALRIHDIYEVAAEDHVRSGRRIVFDTGPKVSKWLFN